MPPVSLQLLFPRDSAKRDCLSDFRLSDGRMANSICSRSPLHSRPRVHGIICVHRKEFDDANIQEWRRLAILRGVWQWLSAAALCARRDALQYRVLEQESFRSDQGIRVGLSRD